MATEYKLELHLGTFPYNYVSIERLFALKPQKSLYLEIIYLLSIWFVH